MLIHDRLIVAIERGDTLNNALAGAEVFLPAACGGKGTCGRCRIKVIEGAGKPVVLEKLVLDKDEIAGGIRLACQIKVRQNLRLEIPEKLLAVKSHAVELIAAEMASENIRIMTFRLPAGKKLEFCPGQYVQVFYRLPWENIIRAYSLSSDADVGDSFSLDVQRVEGGLVSSYLHQLQIGQYIEICGPFGEMMLRPEDQQCPVILVAGGVGLAPLRSILARLEKAGFQQQTFLFHGARNRKNLYGEEHFRRLDNDHAGFLYVPALSEPLIEEGWIGQHGMIHEVMHRELKDCSNASAFVCGPAPMMSAVTKVLVAKGIPSDRIFTDPFDFFPGTS
jgi:Na+-transporting NADH:ubiquinone oxidoreductase subunit F